MSSLKIWVLAIGSALLTNLTMAADNGEEAKMSQPAQTSSKKAAEKPAPLTDADKRRLENTASEGRTYPTATKKMTPADKKADVAKKRTGTTEADEAKQAKELPGGN